MENTKRIEKPNASLLIPVMVCMILAGCKNLDKVNFGRLINPNSIYKYVPQRKIELVDGDVIVDIRREFNEDIEECLLETHYYEKAVDHKKYISTNSMERSERICLHYTEINKPGWEKFMNRARLDYIKKSALEDLIELTKWSPFLSEKVQKYWDGNSFNSLEFQFEITEMLNLMNKRGHIVKVRLIERLLIILQV